MEKLHELKFSGQGTFLQAHINFSGLKWLSEARVQLYLGLPEFHPHSPSLCNPEALAGSRVPCLVARDIQVLVIGPGAKLRRFLACHDLKEGLQIATVAFRGLDPWAVSAQTLVP